MSYIIKSSDELKNPFLCYCIFENFSAEAGEDYIDYNETIVNPFPFIFWLRGRGYITNKQLEKLADTSGLSLQDIFEETLFPNTCGESILSTIKKYTLLAEYMCQISGLRQRLWDSVHDKAHSFINGQFYVDENGTSLACIIENEDLTAKNIHYNDVLKMNRGKLWNLSYKERFNIGLEITIEQADVETEAERKYEGA